jgi:hypothetical protein
VEGGRTEGRGGAREGERREPSLTPSLFPFFMGRMRTGCTRHARTHARTHDKGGESKRRIGFEVPSQCGEAREVGGFSCRNLLLRKGRETVVATLAKLRDEKNGTSYTCTCAPVSRAREFFPFISSLTRKMRCRLCRGIRERGGCKVEGLGPGG